jgi:hypothetical protein
VTAQEEKKLRLSFHGRIIDSLGIQMYLGLELTRFRGHPEA